MLESHPLQPGQRINQLDTSSTSANRDRIRALFEWSRDAILVIDETGHCIEANPAAEVLLGFERDELLQLAVSQIVARGLEPADGKDSHARADERWNGQFEVWRKDGSLLRVDAWLMDFSEPSGAAYAVLMRSARDRLGIEEAGARLFAIVASSSEAIVGTTLDGTITHWNPAAEQVYGYAVDEAVGCSVTMLECPDMAGNVLKLLERVRFGERVDGYETTWLTKEGSRIEVLLGTSPVLDADGNVVAASLVARDVTDRKRAEQQLVAAKETAEDANRALRESEERFRGAFNGASIGMALVSPKGRFLQVNRALCEILGYPEAELLAKTFRDITHPDDFELDLKLERQLLAGKISTYQVEKRYLCKDGHIAWVRLTVSLVHDAVGKPLYFVFQIQDITPYKAAGAALREAEARYRTLVEQIPAAVYVEPTDAVGPPLYISPRVESLLGYSPDEWLAQPDLWVERLHPDDRERVEREIARVRLTGEATSLEYRCLARDGHIVWVLDQRWLVRDEEEVPKYWQGFMIDVTDRKRTEEELRAAKDAAEEASRLKSSFLRMATHELRTPLTIVSGYIELLGDSAAARLTPEEREFIDVAKTGTTALTTLVEDLLDLARIEAGRLELTISPVNVNDVVERVHRMVAAQAAAKGIESEFVLEPEAPLVAADADRLFQVLLNLIGNAIKFTEQGQVQTTVHGRHDGVEISVADTGIGIPPEALTSIFDEFRQADASTTRKFGGTGLGLAIAKRLVEMQAGTLAVESTVGVGSTFTLWLPAATAGTNGAAESALPLQASSPTHGQ